MRHFYFRYGVGGMSVDRRDYLYAFAD